MDDAAYIDGANALVHGLAKTKPAAEESVKRLTTHLCERGPVGLYAATWLLSKYGDCTYILRVLESMFAEWRADLWLGRLVGGLSPIFHAADQKDEFLRLVRAAKNAAADEVVEFHRGLRSDPKVVAGVKSILLAANSSRKLGITHAKLLMLLGVLANNSVSDHAKSRYLRTHKLAWEDTFYRLRARSMLQAPTLKALVSA